MSSVIQYKFQSQNEYSKVLFDGSDLKLKDLTNAIVKHKNLDTSGLFDFKIVNANTDEVYHGDDAKVPKNTSVIIKRVPVGGPSVSWEREQELKPPEKALARPVPLEELKNRDDLVSAEASEEDKILAAIFQSTKDFDPANFREDARPPPPRNYVCIRCKNPGHYQDQCPFGNKYKRYNMQQQQQLKASQLKRPSGIPQSHLTMLDHANYHGAMEQGDGTYVIQTLDAFARLEGPKKERNPFEQIQIADDVSAQQVPSELKCSLCNDLFTDAVQIKCCNECYCDECVRNALMSNGGVCPHCGEENLSVEDSLSPNKFLRLSVSNYQKDSGYINKRNQTSKALQETSVVPVSSKVNSTMPTISDINLPKLPPKATSITKAMADSFLRQQAALAAGTPVQPPVDVQVPSGVGNASVQSTSTVAAPPTSTVVIANISAASSPALIATAGETPGQDSSATPTQEHVSSSQTPQTLPAPVMATTGATPVISVALSMPMSQSVPAGDQPPPALSTVAIAAPVPLAHQLPQHLAPVPSHIIQPPFVGPPPTLIGPPLLRHGGSLFTPNRPLNPLLPSLPPRPPDLPVGLPPPPHTVRLPPPPVMMVSESLRLPPLDHRHPDSFPPAGFQRSHGGAPLSEEEFYKLKSRALESELKKKERLPDKLHAFADDIINRSRKRSRSPSDSRDSSAHSGRRRRRSRTPLWLVAGKLHHQAQQARKEQQQAQAVAGPSSSRSRSRSPGYGLRRSRSRTRSASPKLRTKHRPRQQSGSLSPGTKPSISENSIKLAKDDQAVLRKSVTVPEFSKTDSHPRTSNLTNVTLVEGDAAEATVAPSDTKVDSVDDTEKAAEDAAGSRPVRKKKRLVVRKRIVKKLVPKRKLKSSNAAADTENNKRTGVSENALEPVTVPKAEVSDSVENTEKVDNHEIVKSQSMVPADVESKVEPSTEPISPRAKEPPISERLSTQRVAVSDKQFGVKTVTENSCRMKQEKFPKRRRSASRSRSRSPLRSSTRGQDFSSHHRDSSRKRRHSPSPPPRQRQKSPISSFDANDYRVNSPPRHRHTLKEHSRKYPRDDYSTTYPVRKARYSGSPARGDTDDDVPSTRTKTKLYRDRHRYSPDYESRRDRDRSPSKSRLPRDILSDESANAHLARLIQASLLQSIADPLTLLGAASSLTSGSRRLPPEALSRIRDDIFRRGYDVERKRNDDQPPNYSDIKRFPSETEPAVSVWGRSPHEHEEGYRRAKARPSSDIDSESGSQRSKAKKKHKKKHKRWEESSEPSVPEPTIVAAPTRQKTVHEDLRHKSSDQKPKGSRTVSSKVSGDLRIVAKDERRSPSPNRAKVAAKDRLSTSRRTVVAEIPKHSLIDQIQSLESRHSESSIYRSSKSRNKHSSSKAKKVPIKTKPPKLKRPVLSLDAKTDDDDDVFSVNSSQPESEKLTTSKSEAVTKTDEANEDLRQKLDKNHIDSSLNMVGSASRRSHSHTSSLSRRDTVDEGKFEPDYTESDIEMSEPLDGIGSAPSQKRHDDTLSASDASVISVESIARKKSEKKHKKDKKKKRRNKEKRRKKKAHVL